MTVHYLQHYRSTPLLPMPWPMAVMLAVGLSGATMGMALWAPLLTRPPTDNVVPFEGAVRRTTRKGRTR